MSLRISWNELFPTKWSVVIFIAYMVLFINQGILVTASQSSTSTYSYNTVTVVLLTEVVKLVVSVSIYCKDNAVSSLLHETKLHIRVMLLYFVPAFLYCLYNNLAFINLSAFDPTTYYLLLQFRVVVTGIAFQVLFKKKLSGKQWLSLVLLTVGCMMKETDMSSDKKNSFTSTSTPTASQAGFHFSFNALLIVIQTVCSSFAGVYNEYLLKADGADVNVFVQNVFMYVDSIICNGGILLVQGQLYSAFTWEALSSVFTFKVMIIMFNNAAIGIITSFFLKNLNSILKTFASALELMFTAVLCWLIFGIPIYVNTVIAISIVSYAVILYSQNPVVNQSQKEDKQTEEEEDLLDVSSA
ncbi:UDP-galactose transporter senju [Schistocerca americana]|uniref:UDP-galactose transporter senju n=1 Tax=Schistocerca americana TaxID=7009 RepID=UPI001F4F778A|nr:UDP-galactose transporter senju [Schistocerca americana]XP_047120072.1 UDP-galactose transporter senju [Schistocerca piceifrons]XP_049763585.1 UDP-galactose transporter senju [Schistocerca cancellata]XP_049940117.1 UDP-galactose transporter senju [Schistocerca serialis cubense]